MERISFTTYGHGPRKLVGIHGWFGDDRSFARLEESLDPAMYECAWLSLRGIGRSRTVTGDYTVAEMPSDAIDTATHLGWGTCSIIGHSMGGKAATLAAATHPDRVQRVIGIAPVAAGAQSFPPEAWRAFDAAGDDTESRRQVIASSLGGSVTAAWVERLVTESAEHATPDVTRAYLHSWAGDDITGEVRGSATPTLAIVGGHDATTTEASVSAEYAELLRNWRVTNVAGVGHYVLDEAPLRVGALVDSFLREPHPTLAAGA